MKLIAIQITLWSVTAVFGVSNCLYNASVSLALLWCDLKKKKKSTKTDVIPEKK